MPDGNDTPERNTFADDVRFTRLQEGDFRAFRAVAVGALAAALEGMVDFRPDPSSEAWTYRRAGQVRGIGALTRETPWRWILWSFPGELSLKDWGRVMRFTRMRLGARMADPSCLRIQATARADAPGHGALLARLGFRPEGELACYGQDGMAHRMYAIVRGPG